MATAPFCGECRQYQTKIPKPAIMKTLFFDRDRAIFDKLFDGFQSNAGYALHPARTTQRPSEVFFGDHIKAINDVT
ncbi:hypothetical protein [Serratia entomophila]|uniref:hypothetical protein n=1 Tax=Serratia entomophila TaxID=42906 RepID=UPI0021B71591|nr:hypothetical protein [Serratia entomophila]